MIIKLLNDLMYAIMSVATLPIKIPSLPDKVSSFLDQALEYIGFGIAFLGNFTDIEYLLLLWGIVISVEIGLILYKLVMWVIRKLPVSSE